MRGGEGKAYTKVKMECLDIERWRICGHPLTDVSRGNETSEPQVDK